jgi:DNA adenine methylase
MRGITTAAGRYVTPLRYPGGKGKLAGLIKSVLECNSLVDAVYVEPFAGGAGIALALLLDEYVSRVHINDIDKGVYGFWHSVVHDTEALCRLVRNRRVSRAEWHRQKAVIGNLEREDLLACGFATLFLNRTNRSGIIASGGMIGGAAQDGQWKLNARYNKGELIRRIEAIARFRDRISLHRSDAADLLKKLLPVLPKRTLLYLDPPYYVKGQRRLYANFYEHKDHEEIAKLVTDSNRPWVVSYDDVREIRALYSHHRSIRYQLGYSACERYRGSEVMYFSDGLSIPREVRARRSVAN